jgi:endonuclease/exonuclease/phosphatase family metal-dependent hydrolase
MLATLLNTNSPTNKLRATIQVVMFFACLNLNAQNFPKLGSDTLLDVATWNVEWLGSTSGGPSDETTQYNNVLALLNKTELDVIALQEVSDASTYNTLSMALATKYDGFISTFSQTQKTALYWRKSMFEIVPALSFNIPLNSSDNYAFASRAPLQVCLKTVGGTQTDTLYLLVLHMKAQTESTDAGRFESYTRRQNAANALKLYVETTLAGKKFIVLGDWNDDLDVSIYNALPTPFLGFLNARYTFPSKELTDAGKSSYAFNTSMIDHIMQSKTLDSFYFKGSAKVFDDAGNYVSNFSNNTSDHFPVYAFYDWKKLTTRKIPAAINERDALMELSIYPNPTQGQFFVACTQAIELIEIYNLSGQKVWVQAEDAKQQVKVDLPSLTPGIYTLRVFGKEAVQVSKMVIE